MVGLWAGAIAASDIRVSWKATGEQYVDCLKKLYPVSGNALLGLSGSVEFGFQARDDLVIRLHSSNIRHGRDSVRVSLRDGALNEAILDDWRRQLPALWQTHGHGLRSRLMVLLRAPNPPQMIQEPDGALRPVRPGEFLPPPKPLTSGYVFASPSFEPDPLPEGTPVSIGSGEGQRESKEQLAHIAGLDYLRLVQYHPAGVKHTALRLPLRGLRRSARSPRCKTRAGWFC
jgi:hypothetical protein